MTLTVKRNGTLFPSSFSDLFDTERLLGSGLLETNAGILPWDLAYKIPYANTSEREKEYIIEMAVPGLNKKDFKIELDGNTLSISTEKKEEKSEGKEDYKRKEFSYESFCRIFRLPENSKADKIEAEYENGILKIRIPKKEETVAKPKREISIS